MVSPAAGGNDGRKHPVGLLFVAVIVEPLFVHRDPVEIVEAGLDGNVGIARPAIFLALRTIGRIAMQVREVGGIGGTPYLVEGVAGRVDSTNRGNVAVHKVCGEVAGTHLKGLVGTYLDILESLVIEAWHELILTLSAEDHDVGLERIGIVGRTVMDINVRHIGPPGAVEPLGMLQPDHGTFGTRELQLGDTRHVAAEIIEPGVFVHFPHGYRLNFQHVTDGVQYLGGNIL